MQHLGCADAVKIKSLIFHWLRLLKVYAKNRPKVYRHLLSVQMCYMSALGLYGAVQTLWQLVVADRRLRKIKILHIGQVHSTHFSSLNRWVRSRLRKHGIAQYGYLVCSYPALVLDADVRDFVFDYRKYFHRHGTRKTDWEDDLYFAAENNLGFVRRKIAQVLSSWKPDLIWIHELQSGGYAAIDAINGSCSNVPLVCTVYGNDLYFFHDHSKHRERLKAILGRTEFLHCETSRDVGIAKLLGYRGALGPVCSATFRVYEKDWLKKHKASERDVFLLVKGSYRLRSELGWLFRSIESDPKYFEEKKIIIFGASREDSFFSEKIKGQFALNIECVDTVPQPRLLEMMARSKYHLSLTLSDGVANTCAEAVLQGCVPLITQHNGFGELVDQRILSHIVVDLTRFSLVEIISLIESRNLRNEILSAIADAIYDYFSEARLEEYFRALMKCVSKGNALDLAKASGSS